MKVSFKYFLLFGFTFYLTSCFGQVEAFEYKAPILEAEVGWNSISLPLDIYSKAKPDLSDIRIYRFDSLSSKSIEQPYILDVQEAKSNTIESTLKIINPSKSNGRYAYTFELSNKESINHIHLNFRNQIFDWRIHLEGSMDLNTWSTITDNYRIVSFKNRDTKFKYTDLSIPESKYNYYKISFDSSFRPNLESATWSKREKSSANYLTYPLLKSSREEDDKLKTTTIFIDLGKKLPVSQVQFICTTENDYYRPLKIEGIVDSFETEKGWKNRYSLLYQGTVNSINKNVFNFNKGIFQKLRVSVSNHDNPPLIFTDYIVKGPNIRLIARIDHPENLAFCYGNEESKPPLYDISYFKNKIPNELNMANLGETTYFPKNKNVSTPLFKNKWWLWTIMLIVILLLGTFTLKMLKEQK